MAAVPPKQINWKTPDTYVPQRPQVRPGADDFLKVPSRFGNQRIPYFGLKEKQ